MLKIFNTLHRQAQEFSSKNLEHVNLYTCGPTAYNYAHIGNLRSFVTADLLYRTLKLKGLNPKWVMNITDVDDKTIKGTIEKYGKDAGVSELNAFTEEYFQAFVKDLKEVNVLSDEITFIKVTDSIPQIQEFILRLLDKGYAYKAEDGSTYFSIEKYQQDFGDYGLLIGEKFLEGKKVGARVKVDEYEKENLSDFALWKAHEEGNANIYWDHELLGKGHPGWHIECSVINHIAFKGESTDIHTGGVDLMFPHHTNEIAQSQGLWGKGNFVNFWNHTEHLLVDGQRMGKRFKNFYTLKDLKEKGFSGQDLRFFFFGAHYKKQQNFTWEALKAAHTTLERVWEQKRLEPESFEQILSFLQDDLGVPEAVAYALSKDLSLEVFGISKSKVVESYPKEINELLEKRKQAKEEKDFKTSDSVRKEIEDLGYEVMDTPEGQRVKKKISI